MNDRRRWMLGLAFASILLLLAPAANAYVVVAAWSSPTAGLRPDSSLPTSWYDAQRFAGAQWNNVTTSDWAWFHDPGSDNQLFRRAIDGQLGALGLTVVSGFGTTIIEADIAYDSAENWYTGSGSPGFSQVDLRSVSVHEMGHALGLGHTQSSNCPGNTTDATMCPTYTLGTTYLRTLAADDRNGLSAMYPTLQVVAGRWVDVHALYAALSDRQLVEASTAIFVGDVTSVGVARWNQDSGRYWSSPRAVALSYHEIGVRVVEAVRGVRAGGPVTLTVLGASPAGGVAGDVTLRAEPDHDLRVGDRVLVFAEAASMPWADGSSRTILRFTASPDAAYERAGTERYAALHGLLER